MIDVISGQILLEGCDQGELHMIPQTSGVGRDERLCSLM